MDGPGALTSLEIRLLTANDAVSLSDMLMAASPGYQGYFKPFPFDRSSVECTLLAARRDRYWGIWVGVDLAGFFMLRGFDAGYDVPAFGVSVCEKFARRGLLKLSLSFAVAWCRVNRVGRLMLKVYPDNQIAKREYERFGFRCERTEPHTGQLVYYFDATR